MTNIRTQSLARENPSPTRIRANQVVDHPTRQTEVRAPLSDSQTVSLLVSEAREDLTSIGIRPIPMVEIYRPE